jgi:hypothetical protein
MGGKKMKKAFKAQKRGLKISLLVWDLPNDQEFLCVARKNMLFEIKKSVKKTSEQRVILQAECDLHKHTQL